MGMHQHPLWADETHQWRIAYGCYSCHPLVHSDKVQSVVAELSLRGERERCCQTRYMPGFQFTAWTTMTVYQANPTAKETTSHIEPQVRQPKNYVSRRNSI